MGTMVHIDQSIIHRSQKTPSVGIYRTVGVLFCLKLNSEQHIPRERHDRLLIGYQTY